MALSFVHMAVAMVFLPLPMQQALVAGVVVAAVLVLGKSLLQAPPQVAHHFSARLTHLLGKRVGFRQPLAQSLISGVGQVVVELQQIPPQGLKRGNTRNMVVAAVVLVRA